MSASYDAAVVKAKASATYDPGWASQSEHPRDCWPAPDRRSRCNCGCGGAADWIGGCNAMALRSGCELSIRRWVREGKP